MTTLDGLGLPVRIWTMPVEVADPIRFEQDRTHAAYDPEAARRFWQVLVQADRVLQVFRGRFIGKVSPVHFFWGSFDLARDALLRPPRAAAPGGSRWPDVVTHEAYSHEVSSCGFWPGGAGGADAAVLRLRLPRAGGFRDAPVRPARRVLRAGPRRVPPALRRGARRAGPRRRAAGLPAEHLRGRRRSRRTGTAPPWSAPSGKPARCGRGPAKIATGRRPAAYATLNGGDGRDGGGGLHQAPRRALSSPARPGGRSSWSAC